MSALFSAPGFTHGARNLRTSRACEWPKPVIGQNKAIAVAVAISKVHPPRQSARVRRAQALLESTGHTVGRAAATSSAFAMRPIGVCFS